MNDLQKIVEREYIDNGFRDRWNLIDLRVCYQTLIGMGIKITDLLFAINDAQVLADIGEAGLIGEEVGELLTAIRKKENIGEECADIVIRVMNFCDRKEINLRDEILKKNIKNVKREYLHGDKV